MKRPNYKTTKLSLAEAFSGYGGHSKARPIIQVHGKKQSKWRKKLRRMGKERARLFLKKSGAR